MAQPVPGWLGYDVASDCPLVKLVGGTKKLRTEDDGSTPAAHAPSHENGGTDEIDVTGLSGVLADPQTPAAHKTSHENGGADEISVAGLSGVLADNQVAGSLDTTGAAVNVDAAAPPTTGQVLTATDATHATWQTASASPTSEFWAKPATAHASDLEFESSTLPSSCSLWDMTTSGAVVAGTIVSGINYGTTPAANTVRIEANKNQRRSWLLLQAPADSKVWFYGYSLVLGSSGHVFRGRIGGHAKTTTSTGNDGQVFFGVHRNEVGGGKPRSVNDLTGCFFRTGWASAANAYSLFTQTRTNAGGLNTIVTSGDYDLMQSPTDFEVVFILNAGTQQWELFVVSQGISFFITSASSASSGLNTGDTIWVGLTFTNSATQRPSAPIVRADYYRQQDDNLFYP